MNGFYEDYVTLHESNSDYKLNVTQLLNQQQSTTARLVDDDDSVLEGLIKVLIYNLL